MRASVRAIGFLGIVLGLAIFCIRALVQSAAALGGIFVSSVSATWITWKSAGRNATVRGLLAGFAGGVVAGLAMRTMMRLVAVTSDLAVRFTVEGTLSIIGTSLLLSVLPSMAYLHFRPRMTVRYIRVLRYAGILSLGMGVLLWLVSNEVLSVARNPLIPVAFFLAVSLPFVVTLEGVLDFAEHHGESRVN